MKKLIFLLLGIPTVLMAAGIDQNNPDYYKVHEPYRTVACKKEEFNKSMEECSAKELTMATKAMKERYKVVQAALNEGYPKVGRMLKQSQKIWEQYYATSCVIQNHESAGGTGYSSLLNFCLIEMLNERTSYLNTLTD